MLYFAYGSNLSIGQMKRRCTEPEEIRSVELKGFQLKFVGFSNRWKGGVATLIVENNKTIHGALYKLTKHDETQLDKLEGIKENIYRKINLDINGQKAFTYVCNYSKLSNPSEIYLNTIKEGYKDWNLPLDSLSNIKACD